jgi:hypothetical protein
LLNRIPAARRLGRDELIAAVPADQRAVARSVGNRQERRR